MSAHILNPDIDAGYAFPFLVTEVFPLWIGAIILISGLSATMSSGSSDYITEVTILLRDVYQVFTVKVPEDHDLKIGDTLEIIPNHICSTVILHNDVYIKDEKGELERLQLQDEGVQ